MNNEKSNNNIKLPCVTFEKAPFRGSPAISFDPNWKQALLPIDPDYTPKTNTCKEGDNQQDKMNSINRVSEDSVPQSVTPFIPISFPVGSLENLELQMIAFKRQHPNESIPFNVNPCNAIVPNQNTASQYYYDGVTLHLNCPGQQASAIATFMLKITNEVIYIGKENLEGSAPKKYFYEGELECRGKFIPFRADAQDFNKQTWISAHTNGKGRIKNKALFIQFIDKLLEKEYPPKIEFETNGWHKLYDGTWGYVIDSGVIGNPLQNITGDTSQCFYTDEHSINARENFIKVIQMKNITKNPDITIPLVLYTQLSVLTTLFNKAGYPIKFLMGYFGITNSKKTSIALAVTKIFNRNQLSTPDYSFSSTEGGLEVATASMSDSVLLVDDKKPCSSLTEKNAQNSKFEFLLRAYGDRVSKKRMLDFSNVKNLNYLPTGLCLITGEVTSGVASSRSRMLLVETDAQQCRNDVLSYYQQNPNILTNHLYRFIGYIAPNFNRLVDKIRTEFPNYRLEYAKQFKTGRFAEYATTFSILLEILTEYAKNIGCMDFWNSELDTFKQAMMNTLHINDSNLENQNPGIMFLTALSSLESTFRGCIPNQKIDLICAEDIFTTDETIFLRLDTALKISMTYWRALGMTFPLEEPKQLLPFLKGLEVLKTSQNRSTIKMTTYVASNQRFLVIYKSKMQEILSTL